MNTFVDCWTDRIMQIYPVDVAKTVYQKALLSAGTGHAERPKIKFFDVGAYRGTYAQLLGCSF